MSISSCVHARRACLYVGVVVRVRGTAGATVENRETLRVVQPEMHLKAAVFAAETIAASGDKDVVGHGLLRRM